MSNQNLEPPFISDPPIYDPFFEKDDKTISNSWQNWLNSVTRVMGRVIVHDYLVVGGVRTQEIPVVMILGGTTAERNSLDSARDGMMWYNTTTARFNFREAGAWVTFVPIPA